MYGVIKVVVRSLVRMLLGDLFFKGICVNGIFFGFIDILIMEKVGIFVEVILVVKVGFVVENFMKWIGSVDEIVKVVLFLVLDDFVYIVGIDLVVDGGLI